MTTGGLKTQDKTRRTKDLMTKDQKILTVASGI